MLYCCSSSPVLVPVFILPWGAYACTHIQIVPFAERRKILRLPYVTPWPRPFFPPPHSERQIAGSEANNKLQQLNYSVQIRISTNLNPSFSRRATSLLCDGCTSLDDGYGRVASWAPSGFLCSGFRGDAGGRQGSVGWASRVAVRSFFQVLSI